MKKFGSLLKDHPDVLKQSRMYPNINIKLWGNKIALPETFDGRSVWEAYIQFPYDQEKSESWAVVCSDILADRYTISTVGQVNLFLSPTEIVSCIGKSPNQFIKNVLSGSQLDYKDSTQGYSIYDGWEYIYENGVAEKNCFSRKRLTKRNIPLPSKLDFKEKIEVYGHKCSKIEENQLYCITEKEKDKPIARRTFFSNSIFNIIEDTLEETIRSIKYELLRFGPVAAGFMIYENFVKYDGKTVYDHVDGKPLGGHYVSIIGWEKDSWICRNSWGVNWGLLGFFKIKMGIKECMLESNVSSCSPFYHSNKFQYPIDGSYLNKTVDITDMNLFNPELFKNRLSFDIDKETFYPQKAIELIKKGIIYGDLDPLILFPNELPNIDYYWAKDFDRFKFIPEEMDQKEESQGSGFFYYVILFIIFFLLGYKR